MSVVRDVFLGREIRGDEPRNCVLERQWKRKGENDSSEKKLKIRCYHYSLSYCHRAASSSFSITGSSDEVGVFFQYSYIEANPS
jgi:hypothetical protein